MYKLKPGWCTNSFTILCAKRAGFDNEIIKRALEIYNKGILNVDPDKKVVQRYEAEARDLLYRLNDIFCKVQGEQIEDEDKILNTA